MLYESIWIKNRIIIKDNLRNIFQKFITWNLNLKQCNEKRIEFLKGKFNHYTIIFNKKCLQKGYVIIVTADENA